MSDFFGLDIGSHSIKLIKASRKGDKYLLENFAEVRTPASFQTENPSEQRLIVEALKQCLKEAKIHAKNANICLKENFAHTQIVNFPSMSDQELAKAIRFEAEQFVPVPLEEVNLEYQVVKRPPKGSMVEKMEVLVVAAQKKAIAVILKYMNLAKIKAISLETEMMAAIRVFSVDDKSNNLILSIGHNTCNLALLVSGQLKFIQTLSVSGGASTRVLVNQLSLDYYQAEQYKNAYGLDSNILDGKVAQLLVPVVDILVKELQKYINYIKKSYPDLVIGRIVLAGGSAELKGLSSYLVQKVGIEIVIANPFTNFVKTGSFPPELATNSARFTTAVGLAIKEF